ncbi:MAG: hypothetical protein LUE10_05755 [Alistipes sp.]|nr:hypothetical protein [Alistipes sp.]
MPSLRSVTGALYLTGGALYYGFTDLDFLESLSSASSVAVTNLKNLRSLEGLKNVIGSITQDNWSCTGNLYDPSYTDLVELGKWTYED